MKKYTKTDLYSYVKKNDEPSLKKNDEPSLKKNDDPSLKKNNLLNDNIKPQNIKFYISSNIKKNF